MQPRRIRAALAVSGALLLAAPAFAHEDFEVGLVPCTVDLCGEHGSAPLAHGSVSVESGGQVEVELEGGPASAMLCLEFRPLEGEHVVLGDLTTSLEGHAEASVGMFELGVYMGAFVVKEGDCLSGAPLYITGFAVGQHEEDGDEDDGEVGDEGEDDNDGDGIFNDSDADDDNDEIDDVDDVDDDNDGIEDTEDADPDDANSFDDDGAEELKAAYQAERRALKDEYKAESGALKDELKNESQQLREDLQDRLDDF